MLIDYHILRLKYNSKALKFAAKQLKLFIVFRN